MPRHTRQRVPLRLRQAGPTARASRPEPSPRRHLGDPPLRSYAPVMADLGLLQAWNMWWDNIQVNQHTLYGFSILALGRIGKGVSFVAGTTVVLDVIGTDRIKEFGKTFAAFKVTNPMVVATLGTAGLTEAASAGAAAAAASPGALLLASVVLVGLAAAALAGGVIRWFAKALASDTWEPVIRWASVVLLPVGFHFDLLAS